MGLLQKIFTGGNPAGAAVEGGLKGVGDIAEGIISRFKADPTKVAELNQEIQEAMIKDRETMAQLAETNYEVQLKDAQDARSREVQIANSPNAPLLNKIMLPLIAAFVTVGFFGLLGYMMKYTIPAGNKDVLNIMLGSLGTAWVGIVSYYFGSSRGSDDKNEIIKNLSA